MGLRATFRSYFTFRRAVMTVVGPLDEKHWGTDQELDGWEPRDAGAALNNAGDGLADE